MSMYGMTMSPTMIRLGSTTPACHGSKKTSISCRPRKYHGAFDGLGVRAGFAGSSSGASTSSAHTTSRSSTAMAQRNSARTRCGQVWTLSSPGPVAFLRPTSTRRPLTTRSGVAMCLQLLALCGSPGEPEEPDHQQNQHERDGEHAAALHHQRQRGEADRPDGVVQLGRTPQHHGRHHGGDEHNDPHPVSYTHLRAHETPEHLV